MKKSLSLPLVTLLVLGISAVLLVGCQPAEPELGTEENPVIWSFVPSGDTGEIVAGGEAVADMIYDKTDIVVDISVATEYAGVIEALSTDPPSAHMASLATFAYIVASERDVAEAALVAVRFGSPTYNGQIIARSDSDINTVADLEGKTFARPDPFSTSGWIIPSITMRAEGVNPDEDLEEVVDAGGHGAVSAAVYNGDVDAGATYVDARGEIEEDNPDVMEVLKVVAVSQDIPNDGVQFHPSVPDEMRQEIVAALLEVAEENPDALDDAYSWTGLVERDDAFYDPFRQTLQAAGVDPQQFMD
ncbi:MAG: phosphate/phosphite/phosphonate ABC transporter substrate-binding protein [Spirochaetes bacterium]|jgi:phosphonate transport system substrate-binding protein|nr:phosphate/phosphite/phosphonate ABC transporter substrate-binding protein [Spirochaetota bacterium]